MFLVLLRQRQLYGLLLDRMSLSMKNGWYDILSGEKPMRADEQLAQQVGESRATIQRYTSWWPSFVPAR